MRAAIEDPPAQAVATPRLRDEITAAASVLAAYLLLLADPVARLLEATEGAAAIALGLGLVFGQALLLDSAATFLARRLRLPSWRRA
jgi:hypothetical protein